MVYLLTFEKIIIFNIFFFLISFSSVLSQEQAIYLRHIGYGETIRNVFFIIGNAGIVDLHNITILVDGNPYDTIPGTLSPSASIQKDLYLEPGEHTIEVRALEGVSTSVNITIPSIREKPPVKEQNPIENQTAFLQKNKIYVSFGLLILVFIIIIWFLFRRPKFEE